MARFLLIGLDGAEPSLIEPWIEEGALPHLAQLRARGAYLRLASTIPAATFPAWTSCVTGVNPGRHGLFDFTETAPGAYAVRFTNSTFRKAPAVWNVLSEAGGRAGVLGVPATYPPEAINGLMVSGFDSPVCTGVDRSFVYPESLYPEVRSWRFADFQESRIGPGWHDQAFAKLLASITTKEAIAARLLAREPWDFFMVVFGESDTVAHHFWMFHDGASPRHRPGHADAIRRVYQRLDRAVGKLVAAAGEDITVAVMSDHGFGGAGTGVVHLNNWLAERGHLQFSVERRGAINRTLLKRLGLAVVPGRWQGRLFRRFPATAAKAESSARFSGIDWGRTRAFSEELNYFPSIRLNLRGREPDGQVDPAEYEGFCKQLCQELESWEVIAKAWPRKKIYHGPYVDRAPDIVLELALEAGYSHSCLRARGGPSFRRIGPREFLGGKEKGMNGNHRPSGILLLSKPSAACAAHIEDIAPTVLAELGVAGPPMDGTPLVGSAEFLIDNPECAQKKSEPAAAPYTPEQERAIEERLRSLGYLE